MNDLDSIRQQVLDRTSIRDYAITYGFGPSRRPGGPLHCAYHDDRSPSCSIKGFHLTCWPCGKRWNVIDLVMQGDGCGYIPALRKLAAENFIEWPTLTQRELQDIRDKRPVVAKIAADAADWAHGVRLYADQRKAALVRTAQMAWHDGAEEFGDALMESVGRIPRSGLNPEGADPALIVRAYRASAIELPEATRRVLAAGRTDRENAERVTELIVTLLAASQPVKTNAEVTA